MRVAGPLLVKAPFPLITPERICAFDPEWMNVPLLAILLEKFPAPITPLPRTSTVLPPPIARFPSHVLLELVKIIEE